VIVPGSHWVAATSNAGKLTELRALLTGAGIVLHALSELGLQTPEETGATFVENALLKARFAARAAGMPAIADDSGLAVDALGGAPGVRSARFAGASASDADNVRRLLEALAGVPGPDRGARFHCVLVAIRDALDPAPLIGSGTWAGSIALEAAGEAGFGYDPVFFDPEISLTAAQMPPAVKNARSHRARALAALSMQLREGCPPRQRIEPVV
jgi:XTP/dITP diphosphohydrolase